jgi:hypothetical protein
MTLDRGLHIFRSLCDAAVVLRAEKILADFSGAGGDLSTLERVELGYSTAEYYLNRGLLFRVAVVGNLPLINGRGAQIATSRGISAKTFREHASAIEWLNHAVRYRLRMPIVGVGLLPGEQHASVITIPANAVIEVFGSQTRRGLIQVRWKKRSVRVFATDILECCERLEEPELPEH